MIVNVIAFCLLSLLLLFLLELTRLWLERRRITEMTRMDCDEMLTEKEDGDE